MMTVRIRLAERFVRRQMGRDVGVNDMAREAGWSRTHFPAVYQRLRGASPWCVHPPTALKRGCYFVAYPKRRYRRCRNHR